MINSAYTLIRQPRRKTLCLTISADNRLTVKASNWISKTLHFNCKIKKSYTPKKFIVGEEFMYLGKKYPLILNADKKGTFLFKNNEFIVSIPLRCENYRNHVTKAIIKWYKSAAYKKILSRISLSR